MRRSFHDPRRPHARSGYSLIEMLAVMAILALILGIVSGSLRNGSVEQQQRAAIDQMAAMIRNGASAAAASKDLVALVGVSGGTNGRVALVQVDLDEINRSGGTYQPSSVITLADQERDPSGSINVPPGLRIPGSGVLLGFRPDGTVVFNTADATEASIYNNPQWGNRVTVQITDPRSGAVARTFILVITSYGNVTVCEDQCASGVSE